MAKRVPSGPTGIPVLGSSLRFADDPLGFMERCARRYGDVTKIGAYGRDIYQVTDPEGIRRVLVSNARNYDKPDFDGEGLDGLLGSGLLTSDGRVWREQRQRLQPAFYREQLARYGETMAAEATNTCASWSDGEEVDVHAEMSMLTLRIVVETVLGAELHGMERYIAETLVDVGEQYRADDVRALIPQSVPTPRNLRYERGVKKLERIVRDIIRQRRNDDEARTDVLGLLLREREDGSAVSDEQIRDEVLTMLLAGNDTTALVLTYAWYLLSTHPTVERRFHEELDGVVDGVPAVEDLPSLEYTDRILTETMRLYPPAYTIYREAVEADELAGFHVPAGAVLSMPQWVVHRDPRHWENPDEFRPERWERDDAERPAYAYFPFGGGPRKCIGDRFAMTEAKLALAAIGSRFEPDYVGREPIEFAPAVTLHPAHRMPMVVRER